jgi:membrane-associated phospholipid phosphatase
MSASKTEWGHTNVSLLIPPLVLCLTMITVGSVAAWLARLDVRGLIVPYLLAGAGGTFVSILAFAFIEVAKLAPARADRPLFQVTDRVRDRAAMLLLPGVALPFFMMGFTASKTAIPFLVGYSWDGVWADVDRLMFGGDVWRLTHRWIGTSGFWLWEWFYTVGWGAALFFTGGMIALYAREKFTAMFFTAMFATWLLGGWLLAYCFSAAGPVFAHLYDPAMEGRFGPLRALLAQTLGDGPIGASQQYLLAAVSSHVAVKGGGISAMPSMHLGAATIYLLAARGRKWLAPAVAFWVLIFLGSGYFGYHYWIDGIVAACIAILCWEAATRFYDKSAAHAPDPGALSLLGGTSGSH